MRNAYTRCSDQTVSNWSDPTINADALMDVLGRWLAYSVLVCIFFRLCHIHSKVKSRFRDNIGTFVDKIRPIRWYQPVWRIGLVGRPSSTYIHQSHKQWVSFCMFERNGFAKGRKNIESQKREGYHFIWLDQIVCVSEDTISILLVFWINLVSCILFRFFYAISCASRISCTHQRPITIRTL